MLLFDFLLNRIKTLKLSLTGSEKNFSELAIKLR